MNRQKNAGFTLLEIMVVVAITGILAGIAVPSFQSTLERDRLKQVAEGFKSDVQFARTEAIKQSRNIIVSRTTGSAGTWCYGLSATTSSCDCKQATASTTDDCEVRSVAGSSYSSSIGMDSASGNSTFIFRRGTIFANGVTFSTANYKARVVFGDVGRVRICTPDGSEGLPNYPDC
jgi:type IV fimbrial biogenesis protein FimT